MAIQSGRDVSSPARVLRQGLSAASALVALQPTCQLTTGCERWRMTHRNDRSGTSPCLLARVSISQSRPESILPTGRGEHNYLDLEGEKRRKYASKSPIAKCGISTLSFKLTLQWWGARDNVL
jgi:hypothetical protein